MKMICPLVFTLAAALALSGSLRAGEKKLMHCFAFTPIADASPADWAAFYRATDELPSKIPSISHVWYGKLQNPLSQFTVDAEAAKKLRSGDKDVETKANRTVREYGVCMEMSNADVLKPYVNDPEHQKWLNAYEKVRIAGTTTFNIMGQ